MYKNINIIEGEKTFFSFFFSKWVPGAAQRWIIVGGGHCPDGRYSLWLRTRADEKSSSFFAFKQHLTSNNCNSTKKKYKNHQIKILQSRFVINNLEFDFFRI